MNIKESNIDLPVQKKKGRFVRSLEYELIANLAIQQYTIQGKPDFQRLLSIPMKERMYAVVSPCPPITTALRSLGEQLRAALR